MKGAERWHVVLELVDVNSNNKLIKQLCILSTNTKRNAKEAYKRVEHDVSECINFDDLE